MNFIDMKTIVFSYIISNAVCLVVMALLWLRNRKRFAGLGFWLANFAMQFVVIGLVALGASLPGFPPDLVGSALVMAGTLLLLIGLEGFVGKRSSQVHNYFLLGAFILIHTYFALIQPSLVVRTINLAVGMILLLSQCAWLLLYRVDAVMRPITRNVGYIFLAFCLSFLARILFPSGAFEALAMLADQMLFIILTFGLLLMVNRRLMADLARDVVERVRTEESLRLSEEKFYKAFHSSPDAILITRFRDGKIMEVNEGFTRLTGYTTEEALASSSLNLGIWVDPQDRESFITALREKHRVLDYEYDFRTGSGKILNCLCSAEIIQLDGEAHVLSVIRDITARRQAEETLRRFELLSEHSRDIILFMRREDGCILEANAAAVQVYGYSREELLGLRVQDLRAPDTLGLTAAQMAQADAGGILFETLHQRKDGSTFPVEVSSQGATIGGVRTLISIVRDISERKRAEAEIARLSKFPTENPYPVLRVQNDGRVTFANTASQELLKMWGCEIGSHLPAELKDLIQLAVDSASVKTMDVPCLAKVYSITLVPIVESGYVNLYGSDITERTRAEEHIALQARLLANVNDAIVGSDAQFRLNAWNASAEAMYGWQAEEVLGRNGVELLQTEWPQADAEEMRRMIAETGRWRGEATQLRKDGTRITVEVSSIVLRTESGQITGYASVNRDIADRKHAEETLARQAEELQRSNTELEQFAYVASHDLQEPLRMVSSYMQLLSRRYQGKLDSDADEFIAFAVDGAKRMQNLINDLLMYSRVGTLGKALALTSCESLLDKALMNLQMAIEDSRAIITHDPLPAIFCDPTQWVQVFQNLLGNSIKFRGQQVPHIHISASQRENEWVFSVHDNGIGLDPKFGARIFDIFQRLHSGTAYPGTGIGLAICKRIIQRHGGRIWVESQPGNGAAFYFTIQAKETL